MMHTRNVAESQSQTCSTNLAYYAHQECGEYRSFFVRSTMQKSVCRIYHNTCRSLCVFIIARGVCQIVSKRCLHKRAPAIRAQIEADDALFIFAPRASRDAICILGFYCMCAHLFAYRAGLIRRVVCENASNRL
jgi:hypothetical protein